MLHQIKPQQFYTDLDLYQQCYDLQKIVEFKDSSMILSDYPVLFKADLIFKDFSTKPSKFKYFSSLCEPCVCKGYQQTTSVAASKERVKIKISSTKAISNFRFVFRFHHLNELWAILI